MAIGTLIAMWPTAAAEVTRRRVEAPPTAEARPERELVEA
jgi:hypothetical protein